MHVRNNAQQQARNLLVDATIPINVVAVICSRLTKIHPITTRTYSIFRCKTIREAGRFIKTYIYPVNTWFTLCFTYSNERRPCCDWAGFWWTLLTTTSKFIILSSSTSLCTACFPGVGNFLESTHLASLKTTLIYWRYLTGGAETCRMNLSNRPCLNNPAGFTSYDSLCSVLWWRHTNYTISDTVCETY